MTRGAAVLLALFVVLLAAPRADAACTVSTAGVSFGGYSVFSTTATTSIGTITYNCGNHDRNIEIDLSPGSSGTFTSRTLTNGADTLTYNLYTDGAFANIWGDGTGGTDNYTRGNPANNIDVNVSIYGRIPAQQDARVGSYTDTIIATINF